MSVTAADTDLFALVGDAAHEFRTPLAAMHEFANLLSEELSTELEDDQRECLDLLVDCVDDVNTMVSDMLDIARIRSGLLTPVPDSCDLGYITEEAGFLLRRRAAANDIQLHIRVAEALPPVRCDAEMIRRAMVAVGAHAIKVSADRATVILEVAPDSEGEKAAVYVVQDGPGVSAPVIRSMQRAMELERQGRLEGTKELGLALTLASGLLRLCGSSLIVEGTAEKGTAYSFALSTA